MFPKVLQKMPLNLNGIYWVGQEKVDVSQTVVNNRLCMFDLLHRDTVHSLLTLGKPVRSCREWFVLRFSACLRNQMRFLWRVFCPVWSVRHPLFFSCSCFCMRLFLYFKTVWNCKKNLNADLNGIVTNASDLLYSHQFVFYSVSHQKQYLSIFIVKFPLIESRRNES